MLFLSYNPRNDPDFPEPPPPDLPDEDWDEDD